LVVWGFGIGELLAAAPRYHYLKFPKFCIKIILQGIQKSEITDCDTGGAEGGLQHFPDLCHAISAKHH
jgi:glycerol kinase